MKAKRLNVQSIVTALMVALLLVAGLSTFIINVPIASAQSGTTPLCVNMGTVVPPDTYYGLDMHLGTALKALRDGKVCLTWDDLNKLSEDVVEELRYATVMWTGNEGVAGKSTSDFLAQTYYAVTGSYPTNNSVDSSVDTANLKMLPQIPIHPEIKDNKQSAPVETILTMGDEQFGQLHQTYEQWVRVPLPKDKPGFVVRILTALGVRDAWREIGCIPIHDLWPGNKVYPAGTCLTKNQFLNMPLDTIAQMRSDLIKHGNSTNIADGPELVQTIYTWAMNGFK